MSHTTQAVIYPSLAPFIIALMEEQALYNLAQYALTAVFHKLSADQVAEMTTLEYVQYALDNSNFEDFAKNAIEVVLMEEGKTAIYGTNGMVVVASLTA